MAPLGDGPPPLKKMIFPALFVGALFYVSFFRAPPSSGPTVLQGEALGTTWTVKIAQQVSDDQLRQSREAVDKVLERIDARMSTYRADSELMELNRAGGQEELEVSPELFGLLVEARAISVASQGAFDVTVGPLVKAWGLGPDKHGNTPDEAELAALRERIGVDRFRLESGRLRKSRGDVELDLSAIAKGYAVDQVAEALSAKGHADLMVEIGGEIVARGKGPSGGPWRLGIETPTATERKVFKVAKLVDSAMATSGDYRNYAEVDGKRRSHILDPRTGRPIEHRLASVTVVAPSCARADAWATALFVLGEVEGLTVANAQGLAAFFIVRGAEGGFETRSTPAFGALL